MGAGIGSGGNMDWHTDPRANEAKVRSASFSSENYRIAVLNILDDGTYVQLRGELDGQPMFGAISTVRAGYVYHLHATSPTSAIIDRESEDSLAWIWIPIPRKPFPSELANSLLPPEAEITAKFIAIRERFLA